MKVITFLNEKGGVGKTTLATHTAAGLAIKGHRVILIDADPQANATYLLGQSKRPDLARLLVNNIGWDEVLQFIEPKHWGLDDSKGELWLLAGNLETADISVLIEDNRKLYHRLREITPDYVVIDTPPTPSRQQFLFLNASDRNYIPFDCDAINLRQSIRESIAQVEHYGYNVHGLIPMRYRGQTSLQIEILRQIKDQFGAMVFDPLPQLIVFGEALYMHTTLFRYAPNHPATGMVWRMVERIEDE